ncbi:hypothetical protein F2Q68_00007199 [Brassica cretica]|uniref:Neprosin PEP catalytic domain-containing protein n=1 Tax=Brassica cretica TaxID=69181 RepID=A0A8S9KWN5_BRACR|nr:hypothetical protein F2Q68_00007199 [Brassica cretica]
MELWVVEMSKTDPLSIPLSPLPKGEIGTYLSIKQDKETGNWWAADVKYNGHGMNIGYWPKELFDLISTNAGMVGVTGAVQASPSGKSPPMGNGYLPTKNEMGLAEILVCLMMWNVPSYCLEVQHTSSYSAAVIKCDPCEQGKEANPECRCVEGFMQTALALVTFAFSNQDYKPLPIFRSYLFRANMYPLFSGKNKK